MNTHRHIVHIDMDAFFASVEQRDDPCLKGKPVIIGADPKGGKGRGVVSTCSYEARRYGVHSAMPISTAYRKCPHGIFLPPDMRKYSDISKKIFNILEEFTPDIVPVSIDEAFMDITGSCHLFGGAFNTCKKIKKTIEEKTGLTASVGMAPNMMTAKIASDLKKPDGLVIIKEEDLMNFLHDLPVSRLWGIGAKTRSDLKKIGIKKIGDIALREKKLLTELFGKHGSHIWDLANGIDPRRVEYTGEIKSISNEYTFEEDTSDRKQILDTLMYLSEKVSRRLRKASLKGRTITLKVRLSGFKTHTRSATVAPPTNFINSIYSEALKRMEEFAPGKDKKNIRPIRLIGVKVSNFSPDIFEPDFFPTDQKKETLHKAIDKIKDKFGENAVKLRR